VAVVSINTVVTQVSFCCFPRLAEQQSKLLSLTVSIGTIYYVVYRSTVSTTVDLLDSYMNHLWYLYFRRGETSVVFTVSTETFFSSLHLFIMIRERSNGEAVASIIVIDNPGNRNKSTLLWRGYQKRSSSGSGFSTTAQRSER